MLPPQLHVFVRDWLSSNNLLLKGREGHVLFDSGHTTVNLMFTLLDRQRIALADMPVCVEHIGIYREFNAILFRMPPAQFADYPIGELERSGAAKRSGGWVVPIGT